MQALLRRITDRAGELTGEYSDRASALSERAGELSEEAMARLGRYTDKAKEHASRLYSQAQDHPRAMATALAIVAVGVLAAGVWGFLRYRERRVASGRTRSTGQSTRRKRVKAGRAATAT
jgi:hypothetical protein